jgi:hypothetical protein
MNILDINYSHTHFNEVKTNITVFFIFRKIIDACSYASRQLLKDLIYIKKNKVFKNKIICFAESVNQKNALDPLAGRVDNLIFVGLLKDSENRIPMGIGFIIGFLLFPVFISDIFKFRNKINKLLYFLESYFFIRGVYYWWVIYLKFQKPKIIIMSNDHLVWHRTLRMAAQKNSIPVVYIQHASVTEKFPKLEFDLSLLEGKDALNKYAKRGTSGKVELVGMMKYDKYHEYINNTTTVNTIGFCTNLLDDEIKIYDTIKKLQKICDNKVIIIRPHPRDDRNHLYDRLKNELGIIISDSKSVDSFEYLQKIDINIASESSIHLEAVLLNVYPIYFKLVDQILDHYKYIENCLITDVFESTNELENRLKELNIYRPDIRHKAKFYIDTVGTDYDGESVDKVVIELEKLMVKS